MHTVYTGESDPSSELPESSSTTTREWSTDKICEQQFVYSSLP